MADGLAISPRRVLMTTDAVGGVWDYALELARGVAAADVEVVLAVMGPPPQPQQQAAAEAIPGVELCAGPYRLEWQEDPWADVARAGDWLLELEQRHRCDLVHLNGYAHGALPFRSARIVVGHSCVLSWWRACHGEAAPVAWDRYRAAVAAGLRAADRVVAPTEWMLRELERHYGTLPAAEAIRNGRNESMFGPAAKEPFVLCAGRLWDRAKNAAALARVAPRLPWPVRVAGATAIESAGDAEQIPAGAELLGRLPTPALVDLYARASIYALPARYEPFGLTVLEAALSRCALVLGDIPSLRELWDGAAIFVAPGEDDALEAAVRTLIERPELCALQAARARNRALDYTARRMVERYLALYRSVIATPPAARGEKEMWSPCAS